MKLFVLILFLFSESSPKSEAVEGDQYKSLTVPMVWPASYCEGINCETIPSSFTLRGLWANHVQYSKSPADYGKIDSLISENYWELRAYWTPLEKPVDDYKDYWKQEYKKYGFGCSTVFGAEQYIALAILRSKEASQLIYDALYKEDIKPGKSYEPSRIGAAIEKRTKRVPRIWCEEKHLNGIYYLVQIDLCIDKTGETPIDCIPRTAYCPKADLAFYPTNIIN